MKRFISQNLKYAALLGAALVSTAAASTAFAVSIEYGAPGIPGRVRDAASNTTTFTYLIKNPGSSSFVKNVAISTCAKQSAYISWEPSFPNYNPSNYSTGQIPPKNPMFYFGTNDPIFAGIQDDIHFYGWHGKTATESGDNTSLPILIGPNKNRIFQISLDGDIPEGGQATIATRSYTNQWNLQTFQLNGPTCLLPSPTPSPSASHSPSPSPSKSPTPSPSKSPSPSASKSPTPSASSSPTPSSTPNASKSPTPSASQTPAPSASMTPNPSASQTPNPSASQTPNPSASMTPDPSSSPTPSPSVGSSPTPSPSVPTTPNASPTPSSTPGCNGDQVCLQCDPEYNQSNLLRQLDHGAKLQESVVKNVIRDLRVANTQQKSSKALKTEYKDVLKIAHTTQITNWTLSWQFPVVVKHCANTLFCVQVSNNERKEEYRKNSEFLRDLAIRYAKKLKKVVGRTKVKKYIKRAATQHETNMKNLGLVPSDQSFCS